MSKYYTLKQVETITGVPTDKVASWDQIGFISPTYRKKETGLYSLSDLLKIDIAGKMKVSEQELKWAIYSIDSLWPRIDFPISDVSVLITGKRVIMFNGKVLIYDKEKKDHFLYDSKDLVSRIKDKIAQN